jgi:hypothetical protein
MRKVSSGNGVKNIRKYTAVPKRKILNGVSKFFTLNNPEKAAIGMARVTGTSNQWEDSK